MVRSCVKCKLKFEKGIRYSFHLFPKDEKHRADWIKNLNLTGPIPKTPFVCSQHFKKSDFQLIVGKHPVLKGNAVPFDKVSIRVKSNLCYDDKEIATKK